MSSTKCNNGASLEDLFDLKPGEYLHVSDFENLTEEEIEKIKEMLKHYHAKAKEMEAKEKRRFL